MQPVRYMVANGFSELRPPTVYPDVSPYSAMDGTNLNSNDEFPETDELFLEFSNATGKRKKKTRKGGGKARRDARKAKREERKEDRISERKKRQDARADRKERKLSLKEKEAQTQSDVAKSISQTSPEEEALLKSIAQDSTTPPAEEKKGMSQGLKIGLIVGGIVVAGIVTILIVRNMKKNKK